jgi:hypothetical protein
MPAASKPRLIPCHLDLAAWVAHPPSAAEARPSHCPACGAASREIGRPLGIRGHGSRVRHVRGPLQPDGPWVTTIIRARRFLCRCGAAMLVVPAGVLAHRRYSASALATAMVLYGLERLTPGGVRAHVTGQTNPADWPSLRRWCQQAHAGDLFPDVRPMPPSWRGRRVAERVASTLAAYALPSRQPLPLRHQAFQGASRLSMSATPFAGGGGPPPTRSVSPVTERDHYRRRHLQRERHVPPPRRIPVAGPGPTTGPPLASSCRPSTGHAGCAMRGPLAPP